MKKTEIFPFYVYILLCENGAYYTGYTNNLKKRYQSHLDGSGGCKYTRSFKPVAIAQCWLIDGSKSLAMKLEIKIKKMSKDQKRKLIETPDYLSDDEKVKVFTKHKLQAISSYFSP